MNTIWDESVDGTYHGDISSCVETVRTRLHEIHGVGCAPAILRAQCGTHGPYRFSTL